MNIVGKLFEKGRESKVVRKIYSSLVNDYERTWDIYAISERSARSSILVGVEDEKTFDQQGQYFADELKNFLEPNSVVLDIGCGIGRIEKFLAPHCREIHGIDVSARMIKLARKRLEAIDNTFFHKTNGRDLLIFPNDKFDFVFSVLVLQHLAKEDAYKYVAETHRVLKVGGRAYLQFPNFLDRENIEKFVTYAENYRERSVAKMRYYTPEEVEALLRVVGFEIVSLSRAKDIFMLAEKRHEKK